MAATLAVDVSLEAGELVLQVSGRCGTEAVDTVRVVDRVQALGGDVSVGRTDGVLRLSARIPAEVEPAQVAAAADQTAASRSGPKADFVT